MVMFGDVGAAHFGTLSCHIIAQKAFKAKAINAKII